MVKALFWNAEERRLRTGWRFLVLMVMLVVLSSLLGLVAYLVVGETAGEEAPAAVEGLFSILGNLTIVGSVALAARFLDRRPFRDYGFHFNRAWWEDFAFGLGLGVVLMTGIFAVEWAAGWITPRPTPLTPSLVGGVGVQIALFLAVGLGEELLMRGYVLRNLAEGLHPPRWSARTALLLAWVGSSVFFGLAHLGNPNMTWVSTLNLTVAGLFLGLGYVLTGELALPIGLHITWNLFQGTVFGFPVSGFTFGSSLITTTQGGPTAWTGGVFGPEAGLIALVAMGVGSALTVAWLRRRGPVALRTSLTVYRRRE